MPGSNGGLPSCSWIQVVNSLINALKFVYVWGERLK